MKITKSLLASAVLVATLSGTAGAQVTAFLGVGAGLGPILGLTGPGMTLPTGSLPLTCGTGALSCMLGGTVGTISNGVLYNQTVSNVITDDPQGVVGPYMSVGPNNNGPTATLTLTGPVFGIGFLWGSPDIYNQLTVNTTGGGSFSFTGGGLGLIPSTPGDRSVAQYVTFTSTTSAAITSLVFTNSPSIDAFEVGNFAVRTTSVVPEPSTYALMASGLVAMALVSRRRKQA